MTIAVDRTLRFLQLDVLKDQNHINGPNGSLRNTSFIIALFFLYMRCTHTHEQRERTRRAESETKEDFACGQLEWTIFLAIK